MTELFKELIQESGDKYKNHLVRITLQYITSVDTITEEDKEMLSITTEMLELIDEVKNRNLK